MLTRLSICMLVSMLTSVALADGGDSQASAQDTSTNQSGNDLALDAAPILLRAGRRYPTWFGSGSTDEVDLLKSSQPTGGGEHLR